MGRTVESRTVMKVTVFVGSRVMGQDAARESKRKLMPLRLTFLAVSMDDDSFDKWLMMVARHRAERGSERAKEMLALAYSELEPETQRLVDKYPMGGK